MAGLARPPSAKAENLTRHLLQLLTRHHAVALTPRSHLVELENARHDDHGPRVAAPSQPARRRARHGRSGAAGERAIVRRHDRKRLRRRCAHRTSMRTRRRPTKVRIVCRLLPRPPRRCCSSSSHLPPGSSLGAQQVRASARSIAPRARARSTAPRATARPRPSTRRACSQRATRSSLSPSRRTTPSLSAAGRSS